MADPPERRSGRRSITGLGAGLALGGLALGLGAGVAAERAVFRRDQRRPDDPEAEEPFGTLRGTPANVERSHGVRLHVEELGAGPCLVFAHGFSLSQEIWHYQRRDLPERFRCVFYDQRGHGGSSPPRLDRYALDALAADLRAVLEWTGESQLVLIAHSLAGMVALKLCERHPDLLGTPIAGLVLVDSTYADALRGMNSGLLSRLPERVRRSFVSGAFWLAGEDPGRVNLLRARHTDIGYLVTRVFGFGPEASPAQVAFTGRVLASTDATVWVKVFPSLLGFDLEHVLARIDVPTLVVVGGHDQLTPLGSARHMADTIPDGRLVVYERAGHLSFMEEYLAFNAELARFAEGVLGRPVARRVVASRDLRASRG